MALATRIFLFGLHVTLNSALQVVDPNAALALCNDGEWPVGLEVPSFSQLKEDQFASLVAFHGRTGGTFVEIGGYNGLWMSNTKMLESLFGWSGLLVEANPTLYRECEQHRSHRSVTKNTAVCNASIGTIDFVLQKGSSHIANIVSSKKGGQHVSVKCSSLGKLVNEAGMGPETRGVDFLSVDVEGAEVDVLESFDWTIRVDVACIETDKMTAERLAAVTKLMWKAKLKTLPNHILKHATSHFLSPTNTWFFSKEAIVRVERTFRESATGMQVDAPPGIGAARFHQVPYSQIDVNNLKTAAKYKTIELMNLRRESAVCTAYSYNIHGSKIRPAPVTSK